jgi:zinc protease
VASGEAFDPVPANIQQRSTVHRLDNDIRLALLPRRTRGERVSVRISLNVGDEQRLANRGAACDAAAQMLMRGSRRHTRAQIVDELDRLQTQLSVTLAGASIDTTRENLAASFALAVELLREPAFPADEFAQLRTATLASLAQRRSDPAARASNRLARHLAPWPRGNVRHVDSFEEDEADWTSVSVDEARRCHAELVGATRADIAVVGDFDPAALTQQVTALMGNWVSPSPWARVRTPHVAVSPLDEQIDTPDKANATWRAALGFALRDDDPAYPALALANYILGGHADSRLWTRVREKEGLSYSVGSGLSVDAHDARARLVMSAIHAPQNRDRVRAAILDELRRALSEGFSTEEVEQNRRSLLEARRVQRTQDANLASRWISLLDADRDWRWEEAMDARLAALSAEEVNTALRRYIDPSQLSVVSAGDFRQSQAGSPGLSPPAGK